MKCSAVFGGAEKEGETVNDWMLANPWGILRSPDADSSDSAWHAGRLFDALRVGLVPGGPLLVANDGSGVWIVNESGGPAIPLSWNWPSPGVWAASTPNVTCLAQGIHTPEHVYAGGASLSETDTTQPAPLFHWRDIPITDANRQPLKPGTIHRIVVLLQMQKLVLACDNGVFWATIPPPGGTYLFTQATSLPGRRFSGLAEGLTNTVVAGAWGTDLTSHFGIFVGTWGSAMGPLTFKPANIRGINPRMMRRTDLAACATQRKFMYAVCGGGNNTTQAIDPAGKPVFDPFGNVTWANDNDFILAVLKSTDGGVNWSPTNTAVVGTTLPLFPGNPTSDLAGHTNDGYTGCVGVSPFNADHVGVGIVNPFVSTGGGKNWTLFTEDTSPHLHADTHAMVFDPSAAGMLHICSDGGLATTPDLGKTWGSMSNRQLPNLEVFHVAASPKDSGLLAGSLQDNGDIYTPLYITTDPWRSLDDGDGVMTTFVGSGELMRQNDTLQLKDSSGKVVEFGRKVRAARWNSVERKFHDLAMFPDLPLNLGVVPVDGTGDGLAVPDGQDGQELIEAVATPTFANAQGEPMVAVGVSALTVFGMFAKSDGTFHWQQLGAVPSLNPPPFFATAVAAVPNGTSVFVGMNTGKVFRLDLDAPGFPVTDLSDSTVSVQVTRFAAFAPDRAFLIAGVGVFHRDAAGWTPLTGKVLPGGVSATLPVGQQYNALAADPTTTPPTLYVATASQVLRSEDSGETWFDFTGGLPKAPSCDDIRWVQESSGVTFLYLATFGWSVFRCPLNFEVVLKPVKVDGHMDLTDHFFLEAFEGYDYTLVNLLDNRMLGPLHPFEEMTFAGDEKLGGEMHVDLKLSFAWKIDFSVVLTVSADLKDLVDNETDAHWDGTATIPFGAVKTVMFDLASSEEGILGDSEPDQAHIEFTVTNG